MKKLSSLSKGARVGLAVGAAGAASGIGLLAVPATFGGFTAQSSNPGNTASAGTLSLGNHSDAADLTSTEGSAVVTVSNLDPGKGLAGITIGSNHYYGAKAGDVYIKNTGTLPATMQLTLANVVDTLEPHVLTSGSVSGTTTSIPTAALPQAVTAGDPIIVINGPTTQTFTAATGGAALGATSIPVNSATANATYPTGSTVIDENWDGVFSNKATVEVKDDTKNADVIAATPIYSALGTVSLPGSAGAMWDAAEQHQFTVTVTLPDTADNAYQGTGASFDLMWGASS